MNPFPGTRFITPQNPEAAPHNAILVGYYNSGSVYVGATRHQDEYLPIKILPTLKKGYYTYHGKSNTTFNYDFVVMDHGYEYIWQPYALGNPPPMNAVNFGQSKYGVHFPYFVGRITTHGEPCVAKICIRDRKAYAEIKGKEVTSTDCDILIVRRRR